MDRQALRDWVHRYNDRGLEGLKSYANPGPSPAPTAEQMAEWLHHAGFFVQNGSTMGGVVGVTIAATGSEVHLFINAASNANANLTTGDIEVRLTGFATSASASSFASSFTAPDIKWS